MKQIILLLFIAGAMSSCFIFKKKEKYGCPANGRNVGAEKIASGDEKAIRASKKAKFRSN